jgi:hypothetical protein
MQKEIAIGKSNLPIGISELQTLLGFLFEGNKWVVTVQPD